MKNKKKHIGNGKLVEVGGILSKREYLTITKCGIFTEPNNVVPDEKHANCKKCLK